MIPQYIAYEDIISFRQLFPTVQGDTSHHPISLLKMTTAKVAALPLPMPAAIE